MRHCLEPDRRGWVARTIPQREGAQGGCRGQAGAGCASDDAASRDLYDGQQMRPEKLDVWRALRQRYGNRDESRVDRGALLAPAA